MCNKELQHIRNKEFVNDLLAKVSGVITHEKNIDLANIIRTDEEFVLNSIFKIN